MLLVIVSAIASSVATAQEVSLRGASVIRRSQPETLQKASLDYRPLRTLVIQGEKMGTGFCGYSLEFSEDADDPKSTFVWMAAVDPDTCQFEFEVGSVTLTEQVLNADAVVETAETKAKFETSDKARARQRFAHPESIAEFLTGQTAELPALAGKDRKLTVVGRWEDVVNADVNKVLVAVRADIKGNDIKGAQCKYAWWWLQLTGWQHPSGDWTDCRSSKNRATALADGYFMNPYFPTCVPDVVHVYYDRLWARVSPKNILSDGHYEWGIYGTWAEGARCQGMLHWASFMAVKNEYSTGWIN